MTQVSFAARPDMRAVELEHYAVASMNRRVFAKVAAALGEPSLNAEHLSAWYAEMIVRTNMIDGVSMGDSSIPFAMRINDQGFAMVQMKWTDMARFGDLLGEWLLDKEAQAQVLRVA